MVRGSTTLRIVRKHSEMQWQRVWKTLHTTGLSDTIKSRWYAAIHGIIPTYQRLAEIKFVPNSTSARCGEQDTLAHRIIRCAEGPVIWSWTRSRTAAILRVHPKHIPEERTLLPTYNFWPLRKQAAITWTIAHLVTTAYKPSNVFHSKIISTYFDAPGGKNTILPSDVTWWVDTWMYCNPTRSAYNRITHTSDKSNSSILKESG
jgi:hypothetical protein